MSKKDGYGGGGYSDDGYGGTSTSPSTATHLPTVGQAEQREAGRRGAADVVINFEVSGIKIQPLGFEARKDQGKKDWLRAKLTREAAAVVRDGLVHQEPVTLTADGDLFWKGHVRQDSVSVGHSDGSLTLYDPIKILTNGFVDKDYEMTTLKNVVIDIWNNNVNDPHGVLEGVIFPGADTEKLHMQHEDGVLGMGLLGELTMGQGVDVLKETIPGLDGDGNLDFRGESPLEAFQEIGETFGVDVFTTTTRRLAIGVRDAVAPKHIAGRGESMWRLRGFDVPGEQQAFGQVIIKGVTPLFEKPQGPGENEEFDHWGATSRFLDRADGSTKYGYAKWSDYDGPVTAMEYTKSEQPEDLIKVAKNKLVQSYYEAHKGTIELDVLASEVGTQAIGGVTVGGYIKTEENQECGIVGGEWRINSVRHIYDPDSGWRIRLGVIGTLPSGIETGTVQMDLLDKTLTTEDPNSTLGTLLGAASPKTPIMDLF